MGKKKYNSYVKFCFPKYSWAQRLWILFGGKARVLLWVEDNSAVKELAEVLQKLEVAPTIDMAFWARHLLICKRCRVDFLRGKWPIDDIEIEELIETGRSPEMARWRLFNEDR